MIYDTQFVVVRTFAHSELAITDWESEWYLRWDRDRRVSVGDVCCYFT